MKNTILYPFLPWLGLLALALVGVVIQKFDEFQKTTDLCKLEDVQCIQFRDIKLIRLRDFDSGNYCYTIDQKTISCVNEERQLK
jgi:hypothetical protein